MSYVQSGSPDYYELLDLQPGVDAETVRRAYRRLARALHPDVNPDPEAARRFALVSQAYAVLNDPLRRRQYDEQRRHADNGALSRQSRRPSTAQPGRGVLRGADVELTVHVSLRTAALGGEQPVEVPRREVCAVCVGTGTVQGGVSTRCPRCLGTGGTRTPGEECTRCQGSGVIGDPPCPNCHGIGRRQGVTRITVALPPGTEDGQRLVLKGDGDAGPRNGPRGDLILRIAVEPDPVLRRHGIDILMDLNLTPEEARQGGSYDVPTLKGGKRLRVPTDVKEGAILRIGGAGVRLPGSWHRGDQFVTVHIRP